MQGLGGGAAAAPSGSTFTTGTAIATQPSAVGTGTTNKLAEHFGQIPKSSESIFDKGLSIAKKIINREGTSSAHDRMLEEIYQAQHRTESYVVPHLGENGVVVPIPSTSLGGGTPSWQWKADGGTGLTNVKEQRVLTPVQAEVERCVRLPRLARTDLSTFCKSTSGFDPDELGQALDEQLNIKLPFTQRLNALFLIEALLKQGNDGVRGYFEMYPEDIQRNVNVTQESVKDKATSILQSLSIAVNSETKTAAVTAAPLTSNPPGKVATNVFGLTLGADDLSDDDAPVAEPLFDNKKKKEGKKDKEGKKTEKTIQSRGSSSGN